MGGKTIIVAITSQQDSQPILVQRISALLLALTPSIEADSIEGVGGEDFAMIIPLG